MRLKYLTKYMTLKIKNMKEFLRKRDIERMNKKENRKSNKTTQHRKFSAYFLTIAQPTLEY